MNDKDQILQNLVRGVWVIPAILPGYIDVLKKRLSAQHETLAELAPFGLTALYFQNTRFAEAKAEFEKVEGFIFEGSDTSGHFLQSLIDTAVPNAIRVNVTQKHREAATKVLARIKETTPAVYALIVSCGVKLCLVKGTKFRSASHPHFWGLVFLNEDQLFETDPCAVSIVHELAHQELFLINLVDRLVNSSADYSMAHAPYQGRERPPIGRLHSGHALFRMIQVPCQPASQRARYLELLQATADSFLPAELSSFATSLVQAVYGNHHEI